MFRELLRRGVNPYVPIVDQGGIDALIRRQDGSYIEVQVKTANTPKYPRWFGIQNMIPRPQLFVVCVCLALPSVETWIIPSESFKAHSNYSAKRKYHDLDIDSTQRGKKVKRSELLGEYREAWHLLVGPAETAPVIEESTEGAS